jgi:small-conductance mechanosensitive channel
LEEVTVSSKLGQAWIPFEKIDSLVQFEPLLFLLGLVFATGIVSRVAIRHFTHERQQSTKELFRNLIYHLVVGLCAFGLFQSLKQLAESAEIIKRVISYVGLATIFCGCTVFVKVCRILAFEYFFIRHRKVAFPVLLVNLFTLLLSITLVGWIGTEIFGLRLTPILATSAIFSIVLGLALQDTLGNLFAGVTLQFDKPYEIGDWIEIQSDGQKWVGQVNEISWRATALIAITEETIVVPNRLMAQTKLSNFSTKYRPIIRSHIFRLPYGVNIPVAKAIVKQVVGTIPKIRKNPAPKVLVSDTSESWIAFRLTYFINNYGEQFSIADEVYSRSITELRAAGIELAPHRVSVIQKDLPSSSYPRDNIIFKE